MSRKAQQNEFVAVALRGYATHIIDAAGDGYPSVDTARRLDRALHSCSAITDIDQIWVRWKYFISRNPEFDTTPELAFDKKTGAYWYPEAELD